MRCIGPVPISRFPFLLYSGWHGKFGYYAQGVYLWHTGHIRVDFNPKKFRYSEVNK